MKIGIDMDDTITNSYDLIIELLGEVYNKDSNKITEAGTNYYEIMADEENYPNYKELAYKNFETLLPKASLKTGAREVINKLHDEGNEIIIITARNNREYLTPYITTYMYLVENDILFDKIYVNVEDKGPFCKKHNIDIFIDDSEINCKSTIDNDINTLLFDNSFNRNNTSMKRVLNWDEVYKIISDLNSNKKE